jgi:hypothetical protein
MEKYKEKKSKHVSLAQQNDFGPAFLYSFELRRREQGQHSKA